MNESATSGENSKLLQSLIRSIGRVFEMLTMASVGVGLLWMFYDPLYLIAWVLVALVLGYIAYCCARLAMRRKAKASKVEKPFDKNDRYLISSTNLEKMTADGVPWDVVGALARLINSQPLFSSDRKPTGLTEVQLIQQLVSRECDLERINQFRKKILKNTRVENKIDPPDSSNGHPSEPGPVAPTKPFEPSPDVHAQSS